MSRQRQLDVTYPCQKIREWGKNFSISAWEGQDKIQQMRINVPSNSPRGNPSSRRAGWLSSIKSDKKSKQKNRLNVVFLRCVKQHNYSPWCVAGWAQRQTEGAGRVDSNQLRLWSGKTKKAGRVADGAEMNSLLRDKDRGERARGRSSQKRCCGRTNRMQRKKGRLTTGETTSGRRISKEGP